MTSEILRRLQEIYGNGNERLKRDVWGCRPATVREIGKAIGNRDEFEELLDLYLEISEM